MKFSNTIYAIYGERREGYHQIFCVATTEARAKQLLEWLKQLTQFNLDFNQRMRQTLGEEPSAPRPWVDPSAGAARKEYERKIDLWAQNQDAFRAEQHEWRNNNYHPPAEWNELMTAIKENLFDGFDLTGFTFGYEELPVL